jgi:hypothetical protein
MLRPRPALTRRVLAALDASASHVPVLLGGSGSGRTVLLQQLRDRLGRTAVHLIDVERTTTTPERFLRAVTATSPFPRLDVAAGDARSAFDAALAFFDRARTSGGGPATFFLDEFLELRTFESFPGLRRALPELLQTLSATGNRFVLTSRYMARSLRLLKDASARFEVVHMPALTLEETIDILAAPGGPRPPGTMLDAESLAQTIHALADGRPAYVRALADELVAMGGHGGSDAMSALVGLMAPGGRLAATCAFCYELRLHRARGYGALKAILEILAEDEDLTLTEIAQRLRRTPGSTKDYLSWLEDVDLVTAHHKRYSFTDPLLRVWVRLYCRVAAPAEDEVAREIHRYAMPRLPQVLPAPALATAGAAEPPAASDALDEDKKAWGIIEID